MTEQIHERLLLIRKRTRILQRREEFIKDVNRAFKDAISGQVSMLLGLESREPDPGEDAVDVLATIRLLSRKIQALKDEQKREIKSATIAADEARERQHASIFADQLDLFSHLQTAQDDDSDSEAKSFAVCRVNQHGLLVVEVPDAPSGPKTQSTRAPSHDPETGEVDP